MGLRVRIGNHSFGNHPDRCRARLGIRLDSMGKHIINSGLGTVCRTGGEPTDAALGVDRTGSGRGAYPLWDMYPRAKRENVWSLHSPHAWQAAWF